MSTPRTLDEAEIGEELGPIEYVVTPGLVEKYAEATGDRNPWFFKDSPFGGKVAHPTIVGNDVLRLVETKYVHPLGSLHAKQDFEIQNPIRVGAKLKSTAKVVERYVKKEREYTVVEMSIVDDKGVEVVRSRYTVCYPLASKKQR